MAIDPFLQLDVIREAARKGQKVKDCYRLMCHPLLLKKANNTIYQQAKNSRLKSKIASNYLLDQDDLSHLFKLLKNKNFRFKRNPIDPLQYNMQHVVIDVITSIFMHIFPSSTYGNSSITSSYRNQLIKEIKNDWIQFDWCIRGSIQNSFCEEWMNQCVSTTRQSIDDVLFVKVLSEALKTAIVHYSSVEPSAEKKCTSDHLVDLVIANFYQKIIRKINAIPDLKDSKLHYTLTNNRCFPMLNIEFCISLNGSKNEAKRVLLQIQKIFKNHQVKSLKVCHLKDGFRFLDYQIRKRPSNPEAEEIYLSIPKFELAKFISRNKYGEYYSLKSSSRTTLINLSDKVIMNIYNKELKVFLDYYRYMDNPDQLKKAIYLMKGSLIRTIAQKRKTSIKKIAKEITQNKDGYFIGK